MTAKQQSRISWRFWSVSPVRPVCLCVDRTDYGQSVRPPIKGRTDGLHDRLGLATEKLIADGLTGAPLADLTCANFSCCSQLETAAHPVTVLPPRKHAPRCLAVVGPVPASCSPSGGRWQVFTLAK